MRVVGKARGLVFWRWTTAALLGAAVAALGSPTRAEVGGNRTGSRLGRSAVNERQADDRRLFVQDVTLQPGGRLFGRVAGDAMGDRQTDRRRVILVHQGKVLGETVTDSQGRFRLQKLPPGVVEVKLDSPDGPCRVFCRLWSPGTAPPGHRSELAVLTGESVIRAQNPFLTAGFSTAATWTGVAAGGVAAPIIYHNLQQEHKQPAPISP